MPRPSSYRPSQAALIWAEGVRVEIRRGIDLVGRHRLGGTGRGFHTKVAEHLGLDSRQLTHRLAGDTDLELEAVGQIALYLNAPPDWPLVKWDTHKYPPR